jgi:hypothetical protein
MQQLAAWAGVGRAGRRAGQLRFGFVAVSAGHIVYVTGSYAISAIVQFKKDLKHFLIYIKNLSTGFISHIGAVAENLLFWLEYFLSGCSEKSFSACRKKVFLSERVEPATLRLVPSIRLRLAP